MKRRININMGSGHPRKPRKDPNSGPARNKCNIRGTNPNRENNVVNYLNQIKSSIQKIEKNLTNDEETKEIKKHLKNARFSMSSAIYNTKKMMENK